MTVRWAYAAQLPSNGTLDWGGNWSGNIPKSGLLPDLGSEAHDAVWRLVGSGQFDGKQIDWGSAAIILNGACLREVIGQVYGAAAETTPAAQAYLAYADAMSANDRVVLVACEL
jgi:hypothetical protein